MGPWRWSSGGLAMVVAGVTQLAGLVWVWRRRDCSAARGLAGLFVATAIWDLANSLELFAAAEPGRELWGAAKYVGIGLLPAAWWAFVLQYTGRARRLPTWALAAFAVVPVAVTVVVVNPATRHLLRWYPETGATDVSIGGVLFWPFVAYIGSTLIAGLITFAVVLWRLSSLYHRQNLVMVAYAAVPLAAIVTFNVGWTPSHTLDPTPLAFSLGTLVIAWGVFRYRLLQLPPVARSKVIDTLPDAVVVLDLYGRVIDVNRAGEELIGPRPSAVGRPVAELLDLSQGWSGRPIEVGGKAFELRLTALRGQFHRRVGEVLVGRDVSEEQRASRARREAEARFRAAFDSAVIGMALVSTGGTTVGDTVDSTGRLIEVNAALCVLTGYTQAELVGRPLHLLLSLADLSAEGADLAAAAAGANLTLRRETLLRHADGSLLWVLLGMAQVTGGDSPYLIVQIEDITDRKQAEQQLTYQALHDPLTGLANRALFLDRLGHALAGRLRRDLAVAVLLVDLNGFKAVNDAYGHVAGDGLLQRVAARLTETLRPGDTVARLGGDEFAVVLPELVRSQDATLIAERVSRALALPYLLEAGQVVTPASIGIAVAGEGDDADSLLRDADAAMYVAKRRGRPSIERFTPHLRAHLRERRQLQVDLRRAMEGGRLDLVFQPIVSLPTGEPVGVEALLRWPHPRRGQLHPSEFLPVAESAGLIVDIGEWVLDQALLRIAQSHCRGANGPLSIAVNIAPQQLSLPDFASVVAKALQAADVEPANLCLEVTENGLLDSLEAAAAALQDLRELGVRVALDDFGTGSSSLSHIRSLPIDIIKIDRSFVRDMVRQPADRNIVRSIIDLGHALGHITVAEGIETEDQLAVLIELGCDQAQGYLFAHPAPQQRLSGTLAGLLS